MHSLSAPLPSAAVLTGGMLLAGSSASQAVCAGAVVGICVNMTCRRMGDTCTCMLCSAYCHSVPTHLIHECVVLVGVGRGYGW